MSAKDPQQGTYRGMPSAVDHPRPRRWRGSLGMWLVAALVLLMVAALGGLTTAYLVANMRAVPAPAGGLLPTPTPTATSAPTVAPSSPDLPSLSPSLTASPPPTSEPTPSPTPFEYEVQSGDSVTKIAERFGVTPESIIELNQLSNPDLIVPGQVLLIPGAPDASPAPLP